jgi:hypothetical protein
MTRSDVVASGRRGVRAFRLAFVAGDPPDEGVLLVGICFPQEAGHLVVTDAGAFEQILDTGGRTADVKGGFGPVADLVRVAEAAGADLRFELSDLVGIEVARATLVVDLAEGLKPLIAEGAATRPAG